MALAVLDEVLADLELIADKRDRLEYFVDWGGELQDYPEVLRKPEFKVPGCVSDVYIAVDRNAMGSLVIYADSAALTVKGFVAVLVAALSGLKPEEVKAAEAKVSDFVAKSGLAGSMVRSRANAVGSIYQFLLKQL